MTISPKFTNKNNWVASSEGIALIKEFEGLRLNAYHHKGDVPTIGYGTTRYPNGNFVKMGDVTTQSQANLYLLNDVQMVVNQLKSVVKVDLTQGQLDALVSFTYNFGITKVKTSTLLKKLNAGDYTGAGVEFARWNKRAGIVLPGLVRRRNAEMKLWNSQNV